MTRTPNYNLRIKGTQKNPVIVSRTKNLYRVSYFKNNCATSKDFSNKRKAEIFAEKKGKQFKE